MDTDNYADAVIEGRFHLGRFRVRRLAQSPGSGITAPLYFPRRRPDVRSFDRVAAGQRVWLWFDTVVADDHVGRMSDRNGRLLLSLERRRRQVDQHLEI